MYPQICHIYGPLAIQGYGTMIAIGFIVFISCIIYCSDYNRYITKEKLFNVIFNGVISGIVGGRVSYLITNFNDFSDNYITIFLPWHGGFAILGTIVSITVSSIVLLRKEKKYIILPLLDIFALYAPLFQAIARLGCLLAGCCYGKEAAYKTWYTILFTHPDSNAPLYKILYATQIYSSVASLCIFFILLLIFILKKQNFIKPGILFCVYIILESSARFFVDFWRGDTTIPTGFHYTHTQLFSCILICMTLILLAFITLKKTNTHE